MTGTPHLVVDPIACRAHGLCAELLPEMVELDEWGYPIVTAARATTRRLLADARAAAAACPVRALAVGISRPPGRETAVRR